MSLAIHLIVKNNKQTIQQALESLLPINATIYVADLGSSDKSITTCRQFGATTKRRYLTDNYSEIRNAMIGETEEDWILFVEPWETIMKGQGNIANAIKGKVDAYHFSVIRGDIITKEVRLWHKDLGLKFINPVYETVIYDEAKNLPVYIHSAGGHNDHKELVLKWKKKKPLATEPVYYEACTLLVEKKWDAFLNMADHYIFMEKKQKMSLTMIRYYCAMVNCYVKKDYQKALSYLLPSLADKPTMAEFWCLLGDVFYATRQYDKASTFYENGLILGSRRLKNDDWPFEITKYKEYPAKMMEACAQVIGASKVYAGQRTSP